MQIPKLPGDTADKKEVEMDKLDEPLQSDVQEAESSSGMQPTSPAVLERDVEEDGLPDELSDEEKPKDII